MEGFVCAYRVHELANNDWVLFIFADMVGLQLSIEIYRSCQTIMSIPGIPYAYYIFLGRS